MAHRAPHRWSFSLTVRIAAVLVCLFAAAGVTAAEPAAQAIGVDGGLIDGKVLDSDVQAYLGVPFAAPPVRELRWREPQPVASWTGVRHADRFAPECLQPLRGRSQNHYFGEEAISEDCLYLNLWAPPSAKAGAKLPVVVWIYGGGFQIGSASMMNYRGEALARKGVIYVSLAYRLGAMGFLAHPELAAESPHGAAGDYGFMDQIAGLKWVQRNITAFGGDLANVTVMGQSAGSMSVSVLMASPLAHGLFAKAIGSSGSLLAPSGISLLTKDQAQAYGRKLQALLKASSIETMRDLPPDLIMQQQGQFAWPSIDGYVLPASPRAIFAAGRQNDASLLLGFTRDEGFSKLGRAADAADYEKLARATYGDQADTFLALYPPVAGAGFRRAAIDAGRDSTVGLMMWDWARMQAATGKAPVYAFLFSRVHPYAPGITFSDHDPATVGAYHAGDVFYWLGTLDSLNAFRVTRDWTLWDRTLSDNMSETIVAFARTGKPSTPIGPWPRFDVSNPRMIEFGDAVSPIDWPNRDRLGGLEHLANNPVAPEGRRD